MNMKGITLLEVLVSMLILGIGFLGLTSLQINSLKVNNSAFQRGQAVMLSNFIMDAMRANKQAAIDGDYNLGIAESPPTPVCDTPSGPSLAEKDQTLWFNAMKESLGDAATTCGFIACNSDNCTVKIYWDDSRAGGLTNQEIELKSKL